VRSPRPPLPVLLGIAALVAVAILHSGAIRDRASEGLGRGMPPREAELARGFVLGQDEGIDAATEEDFRRAGLSHLLAVSGQNVTLLALLAMPLLAAFGIPLRERLVWVLGLIVVYVPLAGAGPSIQRAGVMGAIGVLATISGRRSSRLYALLLALGVTLAVDPLVAGEVGWQLSFAAVAGIFLIAAPLREAIASRLGGGAWRRALAEGAAVTTAATLATAPLIAFHFGELSTVTLVANLLAMPAVAPAMWLGMASAGASQVPGFPVELVNGIAAPFLAYIAQVAAWCGRPRWAQVDVRLDGAGLVGCYLGLAAAIVAASWLGRRRRLLAARRRRVAGPATAAGSSGWRVRAAAAALALALAAAAFFGGRGEQGVPAPLTGLRIEILDVGQGDAILLQPARAPAVLVDGGPPGDELASKLRDYGVERLGAAIVSHDQADHAGGIADLLGQLPVARLVYARLGSELLERARSAGAVPVQVAAGAEMSSGNLRLEVLWPPPEALAAGRGGDPNELALVLLARWRDFSMLLTADAEAEAVTIEPGPVDVLKVAHHGSEDGGLDALLDRLSPRLAVISVGSDNPYGHPTAATLAALATHGVRTLRTDTAGDVVLEIAPGAIEVGTD
jgi:competence protein ComEC